MKRGTRGEGEAVAAAPGVRARPELCQARLINKQARAATAKP